MPTKLSSFCSKVLEAGWLAAVIVVPLFFNIYSARTFEPDKITLLRSIVSVMILAWIVMVVEEGRVSRNDSEKPLPDRLREWLKIPLFLPTLLLVAVYIISTIFSISPLVSLWGSYQRMQGTYSFLAYIVVFALIAGNLRTREQVDRLVTTVIITSIPVSLYGIIQSFGLDPLPWAGDVTRRVASNMGNAIFVASYLIMIIPITIVRLIEAMTAIIKDEKASWGYTILAAVYIFALAVQITTVVFSRSRGPMLGILGAGFIMGLLIILILRRLDDDLSALSLREFGAGLAFVGPLGIATALGGGIGYLLGLGFEQLLYILSYEVDNISLLGAILGGMLGFLGLYTYMAASGRGWRWLWVSWIGIAVLAIAFILTLNLRGTGLDRFLDPIRQIPYIQRLSQITIADSGTGKVRVLIWDAAMDLVAAHEPLGVEDDQFSTQDSFNLIRPLVGYGPESMFNAFAYVYPPELAHVEVRGSSADRSHNETMDSLVITGVMGFSAFYFVMFSLFYYTLRWLGWVTDRLARQRLIIFLISSGAIGAIIPYIVQGELTFMPLGLPFGLMTGMIGYLIWQGVVQQDKFESDEELQGYHLLLIGLLGAVIGHFIEVHFVFSIAATYTYFWAYAGLMLALAKMISSKAIGTSEAEMTSDEASSSEQTEETLEASPPKKSRRGRRRRSGTRRQATSQAPLFGTESVETWLGSLGLVMSIILMILTFDFITPQFQFDFADEKSKSLLWMLVITWLIGFAIAMSSIVTQGNGWRSRISWGRAALLYGVTSLSYFVFYTLVHRGWLGQRITVTSIADVVKAANVLTNSFVLFYVALFILLGIIAITLSRGGPRNLMTWRSENWWLYPPLIIAIVAVIWLKNINVVKADIYLKEGERYRNNQQWSQAIELHRTGLSMDSDEDFYYLMLALDYQLMAQDQRVEAPQREAAWREGERIALEARELNPYNPDNTGNMGRYYFTLGQIFDRERFQDALDYFEKATILAPSNVVYHNLWAQTHYILQNYERAVGRLQTSITIDPNYAPSWLLLGDTYAAMGQADKALMAHREALKLRSQGSGDGFAGFSDQFIDQRLNFYISAGYGDELISALQQVALIWPDDARVPWVIGRVYNLQGDQENAATYFERSLALGENSDQTIRDLANIYLKQNSLDQALSAYQLLLERNTNDVEANSALAFIYAQQGRLGDAIQHNQVVLQHLPNDYDSWKNLALLYQQQGELQQALEAARQAQTFASDAERPSWDQFITDLEGKLAPGS